MDSVKELLDEASGYLESYLKHDNSALVSASLACVRAVSTRILLSDPVKRATRIAYENVDHWLTGDEYHIKMDVLIDLLAQEGLLRDERTAS